LVVRFIAIVLALFCLGPMSSAGAFANTAGADVATHLREIVASSRTCPIVSVKGQLCHSSPILPQFYEKRVFKPLWSENGEPLPQAETLLQAIKDAGSEGLNPSDYHLKKIENLLDEANRRRPSSQPLDPGDLADLDFLLSDAFLVYGNHLLHGRVDPLSIKSTWFNFKKDRDLAADLSTAVANNQVEKTLSGFLPSSPGYFGLRKALEHYRALAASGGWPAVPPGPSLKPGKHNQRILPLRERMIAEGYLTPEQNVGGDLFDNTLEAAVKTFQTRNGLEIDGVVGPKTLEALNVSAKERVGQIEVNMERWRWLPRNLDDRYIMVNTAAYRLAVVEDGKTVLSMRVIVGLPYWSTPVFSATMTYLVFNPYWNVPSTIARKETIPDIKKNPDYLAENNMEIVSGYGSDIETIDPSIIDWQTLNPWNFPYRFRQKPGPKNSLGRVKFMFPNKFDVYLHDTPAKALFSRTMRNFSHGCIRIEKPIELAEYLLQNDPAWTKEKILAELDTNTEKIVRLMRPIPVHIMYWTAWADENGVVHFRKDIYERDVKVLQALRESPPA
jgi:L,D-transpeptidase YcbB